ncbi:TIR domain-containing protein [Roseospira visakhapatnamensis]|uniref:Putative nucleotide-binding protein n=1 Tax=Roseospira visakhapatnamensis TaxID=390880 RepID=A0A7W6RGF2_9PROT|nr:nucleotide-binding protein [Roseospira visakhapatnamensis]MBB4267852.1 putative nucleotide-binding protein [Roseospira visakhapatnamensis]
MYNVMVTAGDDAWEEGAYVWDRSRILEHTDNTIREVFKALTADVLEQLAKLPTLFMYEQHAEGTPRIGTIKRIQQRGAEFRVIFEFDEALPPLDPAQIAGHKWDLQLADFEFSRTHWAVKDGDLLAILREHGLIPAAPEMVAAPAEPELAAPPPVEVKSAKVFLVHGRDEAAKHTIARFLEKRVGLDVIILSERPNKGRSILTKFREEGEGAAFAVVLMTPDDVGHLRPELLPLGSSAPTPALRARQNVIFEMGFFIGQLGVERVCVLVPPGVDRPSDYDGIVYVPYDDAEGWQRKLVTELHAANVPGNCSVGWPDLRSEREQTCVRQISVSCC